MNTGKCDSMMLLGVMRRSNPHWAQESARFKQARKMSRPKLQANGVAMVAVYEMVVRVRELA
jgi:hypothetical protein